MAECLGKINPSRCAQPSAQQRPSVGLRACFGCATVNVISLCLTSISHFIPITYKILFGLRIRVSAVQIRPRPLQATDSLANGLRGLVKELDVLVTDARHLTAAWSRGRANQGLSTCVQQTCILHPGPPNVSPHDRRHGHRASRTAPPRPPVSRHQRRLHEVLGPLGRAFLIPRPMGVVDSFLILALPSLYSLLEAVC
jgi:hypothetical protein